MVMPSAHASSAPFNDLVPGVLGTREESSAGTSSSTSGSKPGRNGSSGTPGLQSPAPDAENLSRLGPHQSPAPSSTASSTSGSTQETGLSPAHQPDSSEASATATPATPDPAPESEPDPVIPAPEDPRAPADIAVELLSAAHAAYEDKDYDLAESLLFEAERTDPTVTDTTAGPHDAIAAARLAARKA